MIRSRRGLSTAVGAIFFIISASSAIGFTAYSMNTLQTYNEEALVSGQNNVERAEEEFKISKVTIDNNKFNITIQNTGSIPINITRLWVKNTTDTDDIDKVLKYNINKAVYPGQSLSKIGQTLPLVALSSQAYELKMTTERGNVDEFLINSASTAPLYLQLHTLPESIPTDFNTVVMLSVTNNLENSNTLLNLAPNSALTVNTNSCTSCSTTLVSGPNPTSYPSLAPGNTANFKWVYKITGSPQDRITFTASLQNGIPSNTASADVTVKQVLSAQESTTALQSLGLTTPSAGGSILYLHDETFFTPSSSYQLSTATPDIAGDYIDIDNEDPSWFTNNGTAAIIIPAGKWNASLNYISEFLPDSLVQTGANQVDLIFHLNNNVDSEPDSTGNTNGLDRCNGAAAPTFLNSGGPDNSQYYNFNAASSECFLSNFNVDDSGFGSIGTHPDSTALWFRANNVGQTRAIMFRVDDNNSGYSAGFYQISLGDGTGINQGKVVFEYETNTGSDRTKCVSTTRLDNNAWHHIVAVRHVDDGCKLYIDGTNVATITNSYPNSNTVNTSNKFKIGYNGNNEWFTGDIDQIFHWNDKALSASEVTDLYNAKFGDTATLVDFNIYKTNQNGVNIEPPIKITTNQPIQFKDPKSLATGSSYNNLADSVWKQMNYSTGSLSSITFNPQERLNFTIVYKSGLDMILRHDDQTMTNPKSSYLQIPKPSEIFPAYFVYDLSNPLSLFVHNDGPFGSWFVYQGTRAIFDNPLITTSYAALICSVNSTDTSPCSAAGGNDNWRVSEHRDSIFIPVNTNARIFFYDVQDRPDANVAGGNVMPPGDYNMFVFIEGYDEKGQKFLRNINMGKVKVVP